MRRVVLIALSVLLLGLVVRAALVSPRSQSPSQASPIVATSSPQPDQLVVPVLDHVSLLKGCGRLVYSQTDSKSVDMPTDILERDLGTGMTRVLVSHSLLSDIHDLLSVSPDGRYLLFTRDGDHSLWVWDRQKCRHGLLINKFEPGTVKWSPKSRYLLVGAPYADPQPPPYLYDALLGKLSTVKAPAGAYVDWAQDGSVHIGVPSGRGITLFVQRPDSLKRREVLRSRASGEVFSLPGGRYTLINRGRGRLHWIDLTARRSKDMDIGIHFTSATPNSEEGRLDTKSGRLAMLQSYSYGEPSMNIDEKLWVIDMRKGMATRLASWYAGMLDYSDGEGAYSRHSLLGVSSDGDWAVLLETIHWSDAEGNFQPERYRAWAVGLSHPNRAGRLLLDPGDDCLGIAWWPGPK